MAERHDQALPALHAALREALVAADDHPLLQRPLASEPEALLPYLLRNDSPVLSAARPLVEGLLGRFAPQGDHQHARLVEEGLVHPHYPAPWGRGAGPLEQLVIEEELDRAGVRRAATSSSRSGSSPR